MVRQHNAGSNQFFIRKEALIGIGNLEIEFRVGKQGLFGKFLLEFQFDDRELLRRLVTEMDDELPLRKKG